MCMVSFVGSHYDDRWRPQVQPFTTVQTWITNVTREEFEALRSEVAEMKELLIAAKRIDEVTGQPDCEMEEKVDLLRRVAEAVGVDLGDVFG